MIDISSPIGLAIKRDDGVKVLHTAHSGMIGLFMCHDIQTDVVITLDCPRKETIKNVYDRNNFTY